MKRDYFGKSNPFYGKKHSNTTIQKMRLVKLGKKLTDETKRKIGLASLGHIGPRGYKHTKQALQKISRASKLLWKKSWYRKLMIKSIKDKLKNEVFRKKWMAKKPKSYLEERTDFFIKKNKLPYKFVGNGDIWIGNANPDFININGKKIVIEVYGRFFKRDHYGSEKKYIITRTRQYKKYGYKVLFFNDVVVRSRDYEKKLLEACY